MKHISPGATLATWIALLALTGGSFALSYVHLGGLNIPVAIAIAALKATLVILIFMELVLERFSVKVTIVVGFLFVALLVGLMAGDVATRPRPPLLPPASGT
jgi:cytochrome c oxidase subunit 4